MKEMDKEKVKAELSSWIYTHLYDVMEDNKPITDKTVYVEMEMPTDWLRYLEELIEKDN